MGLQFKKKPSHIFYFSLWHEYIRTKKEQNITKESTRIKAAEMNDSMIAVRLDM